MVPDFTVIHAPGFHAIPEIDGTRSEVFIVLNFGARTVLIGGTEYAGEIKKSIFTVMNYLLPQRDVLSMHCSANIANDERTMSRSSSASPVPARRRSPPIPVAR